MDTELLHTTVNTVDHQQKLYDGHKERTEKVENALRRFDEGLNVSGQPSRQNRVDDMSSPKK